MPARAASVGFSRRDNPGLVDQQEVDANHMASAQSLRPEEVAGRTGGAGPRVVCASARRWLGVSGGWVPVAVRSCPRVRGLPTPHGMWGGRAVGSRGERIWWWPGSGGCVGRRRGGVAWVHRPDVATVERDGHLCCHLGHAPQRSHRRLLDMRGPIIVTRGAIESSQLTRLIPGVWRRSAPQVWSARSGHRSALGCAEQIADSGRGSRALAQDSIAVGGLADE